MHKKIGYEVLLVGDSGNIKYAQEDKLLELLKKHLPKEENSCVCFLGDNIYPKGMPAANDTARKEAEEIAKKHFEVVKNYTGEVVFIPGNHDWNKGKEDGWQYLIRQEEYFNTIFNKQVFYPKNGCPGPVEITKNENVCIIAIDTQWWMQDGDKPIGIKSGCIDNERDFFRKLNTMVSENQDKRIIILGHHPIYSYSMHGGKYKIRHHVFPLTLYRKKAYVPLPFVGSLIPLYRKYVGAKEDIAHPKYSYLRKRMKAIFKRYPGIMYVSGHEHNLQYIEKYGTHHIISGAASKSTYVIKGKYSKFGLSAKGFFLLKFYTDKSIKIEAIVTNPYNEMGQLAYQSWIV
ncbi:metallophosphoesterase [Pseudopedobacter saltans DSM 12145]|uniref:Metallophosphoesterase n=1 Tax=Pseudopedobacter saltans (strain ATCC 51119 / DSM 12145 / JCM 21818 / CCUG 39354 / LMG 10337 / NBRC 100064 / NCIMB 13643) TaxID=762903 RepID=F0SEJ5_PSESL|nr:metallophosphoesterase [Pseudopedobacter saltans]ADY51885.1 metallophosphoesterase [Pseudopedobacter saltans DSM 12145]